MTRSVQLATLEGELRNWLTWLEKEKKHNVKMQWDVLSTNDERNIWDRCIGPDNTLISHSVTICDFSRDIKQPKMIILLTF